MEPQIATLHDENSGATAKVLVSHGFNCYSFHVATGKAPFEVLWSARGFGDGGGRSSGSGIPILCPFPGRIREGSFTFMGQQYRVHSDDGRGNAIHGFVLDRPWKLLDQTKTNVVAEFHASIVDEALSRQWPADFKATATYQLQDNTLSHELRVENVASQPLPGGIGFHPYFRLPLGGEGTADDCKITVPAQKLWELTDLLPTGTRRDAVDAYDLRCGVPFAEMRFDDVFSDLIPTGDEYVARINDPTNARTVELAFDNSFRECVVYTPPHREAICIEPYTCVPDAFSLREQSLDTGLRVLGPGQSATVRFSIRVS